MHEEIFSIIMLNYLLSQGMNSQILPLPSSKYQRINFYSPWNYQQTYGFLMISGGIEVS